MEEKTDRYFYFKSNLKLARMKMNISATDLSEKADLKQKKRIADIEEGRGKPSLGEMMSICKELDVSIDDMLYKRAKLELSFD